jgi:hypothetical protein
MIRNHTLITTLASAAVGLGLVAPAMANATRTQTSPSSSQQALLMSSTPKTVVLDPATGAVISVTSDASSGPTASPDISGGTSCASGDGCYETPTVNATYHNRSFYGSAGTFTGNWPERNAWDSGDYDASVCWQSSCSPEVGPNTHSTFGGSIVTGTSFRIY